MKRYSGSVRSHRAGILASGGHWLGEGALGQESLFDDLDPFLFAVDKQLFNFIRKLAREYTGPRAQPNAVLIPPYPQVPWHVAQLGSLFNVVVWSDVGDSVSEDAIENFEAVRYSGPVDALPLEGADVVLHTDPNWASKREFWTSTRESYELLTDGGTAAVVLGVEKQSGEWCVRWRDGSVDLLEDVQRNPYCGLFSPVSCAVEALSEVSEGDAFAVSQFLERHKAFFGKNCREYCRSRMREQDFADLVASRSPTYGAALIIWEVG